MASQKKPILGYWNIRGLAHPIRFLLHHAGVDFEDKLYNCGPPPELNRDEWLSDKAKLDADFPNLPYYIDNDITLTQSSAIIHYLAAKHGLGGKNIADQARCDLIAEQVRDYSVDFFKLAYSPTFNEQKDEYAKLMPDKIAKLERSLGDRKYVVGDYVTFADFLLFEYLDEQIYFDKKVLDKFPKLIEYHKRMQSVEGVDKYFKLPGAIKFPFCGAPAKFAGPYSDSMK